MRIWDVNPGYLNRGSLLGEHRELHGLLSIIENNKQGYRKHPESVRWLEYRDALAFRHQLLISEFNIRGYKDGTPVLVDFEKLIYPDVYIDKPNIQLDLLNEKYINKDKGRIPFPENTQQLWAQHKYSVMAHSINDYKKIGKNLVGVKGYDKIEETHILLHKLLLKQPTIGSIKNTLQHMWGYVSKYSNDSKSSELKNIELLYKIRKLALEHNVTYIKESTALSELEVWINFLEKNSEST
jgi:hypothetical protein